MKGEIVFQVLAEGGGLSIERIYSPTGEKFVLHHSEMDFMEEGNDVNKSSVYAYFNDALTAIDKRYRMYLFFLVSVNTEYKDVFAEKLVRKLNEDRVMGERLRHRKSDFQDSLEIDLIFTGGKGIDGLNWSFSKRR